MENEILIKQLEKQIEIFEKSGDSMGASQIREMLNSINSLIEKHDSANVKIDLKATLRKFDGEITDGKEPVETITL